MKLVWTLLLLSAASQAEERCAACHPLETARFRASPMGQSLAPPETLPAGSAADLLSVEYRGGRMYHVLSARGLTAAYPIVWQIGSGVKGRTYAIDLHGHLFESPLSWYRGAGWNLSPGYEGMALPDFDRPIDQSCLFCHSGNVAPQIPIRPKPITCGRCHGDGASHQAHPTRANIVNPARLAGPARDSICEQCHLEGEARVSNPGSSPADYRPGQPLENFVSIYLLRGRGGDATAVSQVEALSESQCARSSGGSLWCGSCHDPHGPAVTPSARIAQIRRVCTGCHTALSKAAHGKFRTVAGLDCVSCHMRARQTSNIAHVAVTDHRILRYSASETVGSAGDEKLSAWRDPPAEFRRRDLALAGLMVAANRKSRELLAQSMNVLESLPQSQQESDPDVLSALEVLFLESSSPEKAVKLGKWAVDSLPGSAVFALNYGLALRRAGEYDAAEQQLQRAIKLDPSLMRAYAELALLYDSEGKRSQAAATIDRYLAWDPQSIQFRLAPH